MMSMLLRRRREFFWWVAWVLVCVPAGAVAGAGVIEFHWEATRNGDGGFMGDLVFFGSLLALGQASFVGVFAWSLMRSAGKPVWQRYALAVAVAVAWAVAGVLGWILGSAASVFLPIRYSPVEPSLIWILGQSLRWMVYGIVESIVLMIAAMVAVSGSLRNSAGDAVRSRWPVRAALFGLCALWAPVSAIGGFLFELVVAESAVGASRFGGGPYYALVGSLESIGVAGNVAGTVIPYALLIPVLYGIPTGLVFVAIRRAVRWEWR